MKKRFLLPVIALGLLSFQTGKVSAYFVVAEETGLVTYDKADEVGKEAGLHRAYYEIDEVQGVITRSKLVLIRDTNDGSQKKGEIVRDSSAAYRVVSPSDLLSVVDGKKVIYAVGKLGYSSYEFLTIREDRITSCKSTGEYVVVSNLKVVEGD